MDTNRIAGMLATLPVPAFVSCAPHVVTYASGSDMPGDVAEFHDVEAEVLAGPWRIAIRQTLDVGAAPQLTVTYHGVGAFERDGPPPDGFSFRADAVDLPALADGLREAAAVLGGPLFTAGC